MKRLDLDDLPPKLALLLTGLAEGEELLLVQGGAVAGRLVAGPPPAVAEADDAPANPSGPQRSSSCSARRWRTNSRPRPLGFPRDV
jgi:hypothetical protein